MDILDAPAEDGLSSLLHEVNVYCLSDFAVPSGFSVERSPVAKYHLILDGAAALTVGKAAPVQQLDAILACGGLPVDHNQEHARGRSPDRLRQRGVVSKAFSRLFGRPPGQYRRQRLAAPQHGGRRRERFHSLVGRIRRHVDPAVAMGS